MTISEDADGAEAVGRLDDKSIVRIGRDWRLWARPEQLPPDGDWATWLIMGGRGSGKTRAGAEWVRSLAMGKSPVSPICLAGETLEQARAIMVEGQSGLLAIHPARDRPTFDRGRGEVRWRNGAVAQLMSGSEPDRFRGPQFAAAWCDEICKWPRAEQAWDMLQFSLRLGPRPQQVATTTPRPTKLIKRLLGERGVVVSRMRTAENARNLAPGFLDRIVGRYEGSYLGRQELDGELIEDRPDSLWPRAVIEAAHCREVPELERVVVAVDPPVTGHARSDACGIVVAGKSGEGAVVLADNSFSPAPVLKWAQRAVATYEQFEADAIVAEVNQGGDLVREMIRQVGPDLPFVSVRATRGKWVRAEPVAALYARGLVRHVSGLAALEDEMCAFGPDGLSDGHSPDRVDALVWALTELMGERLRPRVRGL